MDFRIEVTHCRQAYHRYRDTLTHNEQIAPDLHIFKVLGMMYNDIIANGPLRTDRIMSLKSGGVYFLGMDANKVSFE